MGNKYSYYNLVEKGVIELQVEEEEEKKLFEQLQVSVIVKEIKGLAMCLSRFKPTDWNKFLDVVIKWLIIKCLWKNLFPLWPNKNSHFNYMVAKK